MSEPLYRIADPAGYILGKRDFTAEELGPMLAKSLRKRGWRKQLIVYRVPDGDTYRRPIPRTHTTLTEGSR